MLFGRVSSVQKFFNGCDSYTHIPTQLKAPCLKVSSHGDHMCRTEGVIATKDDQKLTIIDHTDTLAPRFLTILSNHIFVWIASFFYHFLFNTLFTVE